jgi:hypothetical protein
MNKLINNRRNVPVSTASKPCCLGSMILLDFGLFLNPVTARLQENNNLSVQLFGKVSPDVVFHHGVTILRDLDWSMHKPTGVIEVNNFNYKHGVRKP